MAQYLYQRRGGPLLSWDRGIPPLQSQAADARSLGAYAPIRPGGPEPIGGYAIGSERYYQGTLQGFGADDVQAVFNAAKPAAHGPLDEYSKRVVRASFVVGAGAGALAFYLLRKMF